VQQAMPLLKVGGHLMFCTCSLDRRENEEQVTWLARTHRMMPLSSHLTLPGGHGSSYHDGSFSALLRREV